MVGGLTINKQQVHLSYRGKGQSSYVVGATIGGKRFVWRLRKDKVTQEVARDPDAEEFVQFVTRYVQPLLGSRYVRSPKIIYLNPVILSALKHIVPLNNTSQEQLACVQLVDHCFLNSKFLYCDESTRFRTYAVEIKPKRGFMLPSDFVDDSLRYCQNCLNQVHKLQVGKIQFMYDYCPLKLFSGDKTLMQQALFALFQHPQRSLRIFCDGFPIFGDDKLPTLSDIVSDIYPHSNVSPTSFIEFLVDMLLIPFSGLSNPVISMIEAERKTTGRQPTVLPMDCVLDTILQAQKLDRIGLQEAQRLYNDLKLTAGSSNLFIGDIVQDLDGMSHEKLALLRGFSLSCTMSDCSIMLTFRQALSNESENGLKVLTGPEGTPVLCDAAVIDVDAKTPEKIDGHWKRSVDTLAYLRSLEDPTVVRAFCY